MSECIAHLATLMSPSSFMRLVEVHVFFCACLRPALCSALLKSLPTLSRCNVARRAACTSPEKGNDTPFPLPGLPSSSGAKLKEHQYPCHMVVFYPF